MALNNIFIFDENKQNMLSDTDYRSNTQRLSGVQRGVASSQLQNKFQYQMSLMVYALSQIMNANGHDSLDSLNVPAFVSNLSNSLRKNSFPYFSYGIEYLTGEKFNGIPVYAKLLNTGDFGKTRDDIYRYPHNIVGLDKLVDVKTIVSIEYPSDRDPSPYDYRPATGDFVNIFYNWVSVGVSDSIDRLNLFTISVDSFNVIFSSPCAERQLGNWQLGPGIEGKGAYYFECIKWSHTLLKYTKAV